MINVQALNGVYTIEVQELGIPGVAGESAYQYAIRTGKFVGTEEEWYASFSDVANNKVDKELGKSLVSDLEIAKLLTVEEGAEKNVPFTGLATEQFVNDGLALKVDKENGKSLISVLEIVRLQNVVNQTRQSLNVDLVDNTADIDKPISNAQSAGLSLKVNKESGKSLIADSEITRLSSVTNQTKASLGLGNVDNTSDANKPISNAQSAGLLLKVDKVSGKSLISDSEIIRLASVNNQDISTKLDKVSTVDVEQIYIKNANGTQGMRPFTDFAGGGGGGIDPSIQQNISGNVTATELMKNKVLIVTANTIFTIGNTILSKDWTVKVIVKNGIFEFRKGTTRVWSTGNPDPILEVGSDFTIRQEGTTNNLLVSGKFVSNPFIGYFDTKLLSPGSTNEKTLLLQFLYSSSPMYVDWGDGTQEYLPLINFQTQFQTKVYADMGTKLVKIWSNDFSFSFGGNTYYDKLKAVKFLNYGNMFFGQGSFSTPILFDETMGIPKFRANSKNTLSVYGGAKINNLELADWSVITDLSFAFRTSLLNQKIGNLNVSNVVDFSFFMAGKTPLDYSAENYDHLLNGWTERSFVPNKNIPFGTIKHTAAATQAKALMTRPYTLKPITNAVNNGSGLIRITALLHGLTTGNKVLIRNVIGGMGINRAWNVTVIDVNTVDLIGSVYSTAYESGGEIVTGWGYTITDGGL